MDTKTLMKEIKLNKINKKIKCLEILRDYLKNEDIPDIVKDKFLKNKYFFSDDLYKSDDDFLINYLISNLPRTTKKWTKHWVKDSTKKIRKSKSYYMGLNELENFSKISSDVSIRKKKLIKYTKKLLYNCPLNKLVVLLEKGYFSGDINDVILEHIRTSCYKEFSILNILKDDSIDIKIKNTVIDGYVFNIQNNNYDTIDFDNRFKILKYIDDIEINKTIVTNTIKQFGTQISKGKWDVDSFVKIIRDYSNKNILNQYIDIFCDLLNKLINIDDLQLSKNYLELVKILRNNKDVNELIEKNFTSFVISVVRSTSSMQNIDIDNKLSDSELNNLTDRLISVITKVMNHENASIKDIEYKGMGAYCFVLGIKSKIIKIGPDRVQYSMKNSSYILQPIIRERINNNYVIEVTEMVDTSYVPSEEELYQLYSNIRDEGVIWTDIRTKNVGVLLRDNTPDYISKLRVDNDKLYDMGIDGKIKKILNKGSLVVIDLDYCFDDLDKDNIIIPKASANIFREFEKRYLTEKKYVNKTDFSKCKVRSY